MILQALKEYYDRKPKSEIAQRGWFKGKIDFVIILNREGRFFQLDPLQETKEGKKISHPCFLPYVGKQALKHTMSGKDANLLWDNATYVLGLGKNGKAKLESFISTIKERLGDIIDQRLTAVLNFLENGLKNPAEFKPITHHDEYGEEIRKGRSYLTFRLQNDEYQFVFQEPRIMARISEAFEPTKQIGTCLVTGEEKQPIELCHLVIKNLYGAQKDPNLVSFNKTAFNSYKKEQSANAPVSKKAAFEYTQALNYLTSKELRQKIHVGDSTVLFWSAKDTDLEKQISDFFSEPFQLAPDNTRAVESLYKSIHTGAYTVPEKTIKFYVLMLAPFGPRIAVRCWIEDTVQGMSEKIRSHFEDTKIIIPKREKESWHQWLPLNSLLAATANETKFDSKKQNLVRFKGKYYDVKPNLASETVRTILAGLPYPQTLLQAAVRRFRAERDITYPRAALIKACINRAVRFKFSSIKEELKMSLDEKNVNIGYRLGRLFATLERIQIRKFTQNGGKEPNSTIRDSFYGSASGTPGTVFGTLIRLSKHHLSALDNTGERVNLEHLIGEIMSEIKDFPAYLCLEDQGRFAIGYYHQMQVFFIKKENKNQGGNND